jgi:hypothetical protein
MGDPKIDSFLNPDSITGLEVPITGLMNDRFAAQTSSAIRRTFATKRRSGAFIGAFAPYGYLKDPSDRNRLILDPDIVPIKRDIYRWLVRDGMSLSGAAQRLNELGIPNPTAYKKSLGWRYSNPHAKDNDGLWSGATVRRMMLAKVNCGHMEQGRQRVVSYKVHEKVAVPKEEWFFKANTHEPTFTQAEYDTLARLLTRDARTANDRRSLHLFAGFLKCADCGKALQRRPAGNHVYYSCRTHAEKSKARCTPHSIREDRLRQLVWDTIRAQTLLVESLCDIVEEVNSLPSVDAQTHRIDKMLHDKRREMSKARALSDGLYVDWKSGEITHADYRRLKDRFEAQMDALSASIAHLEAERQGAGQGAQAAEGAFTALLQHGNNQALDRALLIELVEAIHVHEGKQITMVFRCADALARLVGDAVSPLPGRPGQ